MLKFKRFILETTKLEDHPDYKQAMSLRDVVNKNRPDDAHHFNHFFDRAMKHGSPTHARDFARDVINGDIPMKDVRSRTYMEPNKIWAKAEGKIKSKATEKSAPSEKTTTSKESEANKTLVKSSAPGPVASGSSAPSRTPTPVKPQSKIPQNIEIDPAKVTRIEARPPKPIPQATNLEKAKVERKEEGKRGPKGKPTPEPEVKSTVEPGLPPKTTPPIRPTYSQPKPEPQPKPSVEPLERPSRETIANNPNMSHIAIMRHYQGPQRIIDRETTTTIDRNKIAQPTGTDTHTADGNLRGNKSSLKMPKFMQAALAARNGNG